MFTGITRGTFPVVDTQRSGTALSYTVELSPGLVAGLEIGASVAIDGVCQTVVQLDGQQVRFDAIEETLRLTTLNELQEGTAVNVERSFRVGDEVGGHEVSGHIVGTGNIARIHQQDGTYDVSVVVNASWMKYIMPKGFIAIDGSSLTVGTTSKTDAAGSFTLHLIPETLRLTKLGSKQVGDRVNVELDSRTVAIVDTVERVLEERARA